MEENSSQQGVTDAQLLSKKISQKIMS